MNQLDSIYQRFIPMVIRQNQKTTHGINSDKLYRQTSIPLDDERTLNIRWIKIPTFQRDQHQYYYTVFLNNIELWRKGEIRNIQRQTLETTDKQHVDSYTIFMLGRFYGCFEINQNMKWYKTFIINSMVCDNRHESMIYGFISSFLQNRLNRLTGDGLVFGDITRDVVRLRGFCSVLDEVMVFNNNKVKVIKE